VRENATATVNNIAAHQWLFRFGMVSELVSAVLLIFLVLVFYRFFKGVDQNLAVLVVIFGGVMPAIIYFVNVVSHAGAQRSCAAPISCRYSTNLSGTRSSCCSSACTTFNSRPR
jgi:hypothetical protein